MKARIYFSPSFALCLWMA